MIRFQHVLMLSLLFATIASAHAVSLPDTGKLADLDSASHRMTDTKASINTPDMCECAQVTKIRTEDQNAFEYITTCQCGPIKCITAWNNTGNGTSSALQCFK